MQNGQVVVLDVSHSEQVSVRDQISKITSQYIGYTVPIERDTITEYPRLTKTGMINDFIHKVRKAYLDKKTLATGKMDLTDKTMTQEQMAVAVALDMTGKKILSPNDRIDVNTALYSSIRKMVYQLALKFSTTCQDDVDDLAQDCMYRVLKQLCKFDPKKGRFTTWTWRVCQNVLSKKYRVGLRTKNLIVDEGHILNDEGESTLENRPSLPISGVQHRECNSILAHEMMDSVRSLAVQYPKHKELILQMFGDPDQGEFMFASSVCVSDAAKAAGVEYSQARTFYSKVVRPFFRQQFEGC